MQTDHSKADRNIVNNAYYDSLGEGWSRGQDPVNLLRAEGRLKNAWVLESLKVHGKFHADVLDIGCGGGFLTNELAAAGHRVTGIDLSESSLAHAKTADLTKTVDYLRADAYSLPFAPESFDAVTCLDFLEHVSKPELVISEAARVLRHGGLFFYHTFNRNPLAHLVVIKGMEWFVKGTPEKLHVAQLFIKPLELKLMLEKNGMRQVEERGLRPRINGSFWRMLSTGRVDEGFLFKWTSSTLISYAGLARK